MSGTGRIRDAAAPAVLAALVVVAFVLGGCSNNSGPSESGYLEPSSPANVLANFDRAYNERDVDRFLECLADSFRFYFTEEDQQGWPQLPPWLYKADEQQIHENMFGDDWGVESIRLEMTTTATETLPGWDTGRPTNNDVLIRADCDLRVVLAGDLTYLATTPQEFIFRAFDPRRGRDREAEWQMIGWRDMEAPEQGSREDAGWGGIKFCFLEELAYQARRTSPAEVIDQLATAYVARDVDDYLDCLSEDFMFYPCEEDVQNPDMDIPPWWFKADERSMHANMFDAGSNVNYIALTLTEMDVEHDPGDPGDPSDDTYVHLESVDLRVNVYGALTYLADAPSEFHLRADQDEEGPYGEMMWEVYQWYDDPVTGRELVDRTENTSWGAIKALYW
jgi:hypothetical protein